MSMLAEKRRQTWCAPPKGRDIREDASNIGLKLMQKMGWKSGKGLGANENGIVEHIKVSRNINLSGVGYKATEEFTEHDDNFASLLEALNTTNGETKVMAPEIETKSLEQKSSKSKVRVHYHKFTRGKDLSRYSEKDLANIFGRKSFIKDKKNIEPSESNDDKTLGVQITSSGSMTDYFKRKLSTFGKRGNGFGLGSNCVVKNSVEENTGNTSDTERPTFGFGFSSEPKREITGFGFDYKAGMSSFVKSENFEETIEETEENENKSKKKRKRSLDAEVKDETAIDNEETPKKKKKLKLKQEDAHDAQERSLDAAVKIEVEDETVVENEETPKKDKKLKLKQEDANGTQETPVSNGDVPKKKKRKLSIKNETEDEPKVEVVIENGETPKKKKKSKLKQEDTNIAGENAVSNNDVPQTDVESSKKSKKTKQNKVAKEGFDNPALSDSSFNAQDSLNGAHNAGEDGEHKYEVKRKEKKSKKKKQLEEAGCHNPALEDFNLSASASPLNSIGEDFECAYEVKRKEKKSKNKKKRAEDPQNLEVTNTNGVTGIEGNIECDLMLNVTTQLPITPKLKSALKDDSLINAFDTPESIPRRGRKSVRFSEVNEERIIPPNGYNDQEIEDIKNRNELFEINTLVIENSLEEQMKENGEEGFINNGFDIKSIDNISFYETNYENPLPAKKKNKIKKKERGLDNAVFDRHANALEENIESITKTIENYQAEVENDINEKKDKKEQ